MKFTRAAAAALICCGLLGTSAFAQDDEQVAADAMDFAMHDAEYTMYHEIGHLLVNELDLPVLGKEEDAADALAVILMLNDTADLDESANALIDSADGWYFNAVKADRATVEDLSYYDSHSLDIQRAYAMVCMMVGAKPEDYKETADAYDMDADGQAECSYTYSDAERAWNKLLEPFLATEGHTGEAITVVYEDAAPGFEQYKDELQSRAILDNAAALVSAKFVLPRPITFLGTQCDTANAWYSNSDAQITYCYTLTGDMHDLYVNDIIGSGDEGTSEEDTGESDGAEESE
ncbi:hypothetical protein ABIB57_000421 [Devosia sp. UYZn731]|uniref:DUF4344 domain-containing metallopeptidase n=1 Tax=Devosia sp. UYZn731 TaxID=3156345 RepID=UPI003399542A